MSGGAVALNAESPSANKRAEALHKTEKES